MFLEAYNGFIDAVLVQRIRSLQQHGSGNGVVGL